MKKTIFREQAMRRLASPEQLDQLVTVTSPAGWLALASVSGLLFAAVFWSFTGNLPTRITGQGLLIRSGGIANVCATGTGRIADVLVKPGDFVRRNQPVAVISQPGLMEKIRDARRELEAARQESTVVDRIQDTNSHFQLDLIARERRNTESQIAELVRQSQVWKDQAEVEDGLFRKGLVTRQEAVAARQRVTENEEAVARLRLTLSRLTADEFTAANQPRPDLLARRNRISGLERQVHMLEVEFAELSNVLSPSNGRVLEVKAEPGSLLNPGGVVVTLEGDVPRVEVVLFVPATRGKEIEPGMPVDVSPTNVRREEHGFLRARVIYVSSFPVSADTMMRRFGNEALLQSLSAAGPLTEVRAQLLTDTASPSGYRWSSGKGPKLLLTSGTLCSGGVGIRKQRPIELVFPILARNQERQWAAE